MQWLQCNLRWMQYVVMDDAVLMNVHAACCDIGCIAHDGGCSDHAMLARPMQFPCVWIAVPREWMLCPTRWMQYVVREDAVPMKVDALILQWLQCPLQFP